MSKFKLTPYQEQDYQSYVEFALNNWGPTAYQANKNYIKWLYKESPASIKKDSDFLLVKDSASDKVIGSIHKLRLPWLVNGKILEIPAIHNLLVDKNERIGSGLFLITSSFKGEEHVFVSGVNPPLSKAYAALRCQKMVVNWYRVVISPLAIVKSFLANKLGKSKTCNIEQHCQKYSNKNYICTINPDYKTIKNIVNIVNSNNEKTQVKIMWTPEWLQWRCFHKIGPKHLLFINKDNTEFIIYSIGIRKGIKIARIIESTPTNKQKFQKLYKESVKELKKLGCGLLLIYTTDKQLINNINSKPFKSKTETYFYHKDKQPFTDCSFNASSGDFGFEAIN